jgi:serine O-acetyltransferase
MILDEKNLGLELKFLFQKFYVLNDFKLNFDDFEIYNEALELFQYDYNRYFNDSVIIKEKVFSRLELIGILLYRVSRAYFKINDENSALHLSNLGRIISGFEIFYTADIGQGLKINHGLGTVIGARCKIGKNALIHQNVTFGDKNGLRPVLLDNVTVYAGAKILGGITCGNNSIVAANCVCMINVPDNSVVIGVPGKIKM